MRARMIAFYIVGPSMKTSRNALFVDSTNSIVRKDGGDDENCNRNRRKGEPKKLFCKQGVKIVAMAQGEV
jgi:hypothetical protein